MDVPLVLPSRDLQISDEATHVLTHHKFALDQGAYIRRGQPHHLHHQHRVLSSLVLTADLEGAASCVQPLADTAYRVLLSLSLTSWPQRTLWAQHPICNGCCICKVRTLQTQHPTLVMRQLMSQLIADMRVAGYGPCRRSIPPRASL